MAVRQLYEQQKDAKTMRTYLPALLAFKLADDSENKINARNKISSKLLSVHGFAGGHDSPGLVVNWSALEPKLERVYESDLLNAIKHYKRRHVIDADDHAEELSFRRLHVYVVTRLDLSHNAIGDSSLPLCLFQMESLRCLKLNHNQIKRLPLSKNAELDDLGSKSDRFQYLSLVCVHQTRRIFIDFFS